MGHVTQDRSHVYGQRKHEFDQRNCKVIAISADHGWEAPLPYLRLVKQPT